jgi:hypothetical protein
MSNPWFRFYSAAMRNPKVAALSDRDFRLWVALLAASSENDGRLPPADELKHLLRMRLDHLLTGLDRLIRAGLIDALEHGYAPHHWEKFQYKSDSSTDRVREHRAKGNVSGTAPEADTEQNRKKEPIAQQPDAGRAPPMLLDKLFEAAGIAGFREERHPGLLKLSPITALIDRGYDLDADILPIIRERAPNKTFSSWSFFTGAIIDAHKAKAAIPQKPATASEDWATRLKVWREDATWSPAWGPKPDDPKCRAPAELLRTAA